MQIRVFRNLTRKCMSVQGRVAGSQGWRTVAHVREVLLSDVRFTVSTAGRDRTVRTGRKSVHAWLDGTLVSLVPHGLALGTPIADMGILANLRAASENRGGRPAGKWKDVRYNPIEAGFFQEVLTGVRVDMADNAIATSRGVQVVRLTIGG